MTPTCMPAFAMSLIVWEAGRCEDHGGLALLEAGEPVGQQGVEFVSSLK